MDVDPPIGVRELCKSAFGPAASGYQAVIKVSGSSSLSWAAQEVLPLLVDSRTGATPVQLAGQSFLPQAQVLDALDELAARRLASRRGRRWRATAAAVAVQPSRLATRSRPR